MNFARVSCAPGLEKKQMCRLIKISASILVGLTVVFFGSAQRADATVLFSDSFQGTLSQWTGQHGGSTSGVIVNDPLGGGGKALTFNSLDSGGDLFTIGTFSSA